MCFTIAIHLTRNEIEKRFGARFREGTDFQPTYYQNAFSLPRIPVITGHDTEVVELYQWGLIPFWVKDAKSAAAIQKKTFNARAESITEKPSFRSSIKSKRCLVVSRGFFEWQLRGNRKIPYYVYLDKEEAFAFAGIYDQWTDRQTGEIASTFSIITTEANPMMAEIHNTKKRMPVILPAEHEKTWLDAELQHKEVLELLRPFDESKMNAHTISRNISMPGAEKDTPDTLRKVSYDDQTLF